MSKICENCGRRLPCKPCSDRTALMRSIEADWAVWEDPELCDGGATVIVWFAGTEDQQRQLLNRLIAEWPWAVAVIEPLEPGDQWGARLARYPEFLNKSPHAEYRVCEKRFVELPDIGDLLQMLFREKL